MSVFGILIITQLYKHEGFVAKGFMRPQESDELHALFQSKKKTSIIKTNKSGCLLDYINIWRNVSTTESKIDNRLERAVSTQEMCNYNKTSDNKRNSMACSPADPIRLLLVSW